MYCIWILLHKHLFCPLHRPWLIIVCMIVMLNISSTFSKTLQCMLLTCQHACSHSAGYVFGPLLQQELKEFKDMWKTATECGGTGLQPAHVMSQMMCITFTVSWVKSPQISKVCVYYASTCLPICIGEDYRQNIDPGLLAHCMLHCTHNAAPFYPPEFQVLADHILFDLFLTQRQITVHNCKVVYLYIVYELSTLL